MNNEIKENVLSILKEIKPTANFENSNDLTGDGLIDSFAMINLVGALEDEFDVEIGAQDILKDNFNSVNAITALIERLSDED